METAAAAICIKPPTMVFFLTAGKQLRVGA